MGTNKKKIKFLDFIMIFTWISLTKGRGIKKDYSSFIPDGHLEDVNSNDWGEFLLPENYTIVDLAVDAPDYEAPINIRKALSNATLSHDAKMNQFAPGDGVPRLINSLAKLYKKLTNLTLDPKENIAITAGATGAVFNSLFSNIIPGDEWILIDPCYTLYKPVIDLSQGIARFTSLKLRKRNGTITSSDWILDRRELASLFNNRTKGILINNPNNPTGKEYTYNELQFIAQLAKKWNVTVISDEAHEFVTRKPHIRIAAAFPGMFKRTITIGTSTKSFSVSGWRIGWAYGPANLIQPIKTLGFRTIDVAPTPNQEGIGFGVQEELRNFGKPESYFVIHRERGRKLTNLTVQIFKESGMIPIEPEGINCVLVNWTSLKGVPVKPGESGAAERFHDWLLQKVGIQGFPLTNYCNEQNQRSCEDYIRYCYDKKEETIDELARRLKKLKLEFSVKSVENNL